MSENKENEFKNSTNKPGGGADNRRKKSASTTTTSHSKRTSSNPFILYGFPLLVAILLWYFLNKQIFDLSKKNTKSADKTTKLDANNLYKVQEVNEESQTNSELSIFKYQGGLNDESAKSLYKLKFTQDELNFRNEIVEAENLIESKDYKEATKKLKHLAQRLPNSPRCVYASAVLIDKLADLEQSNQKLKKCIEIYKKLLTFTNLEKSLIYLAGKRLVNRLQFLGKLTEAIKYNQYLVEKIPENIDLINELGISYLLANKPKIAKEKFEKAFKIDLGNPVSQCHYAFILKTYENKINESIEYFENCLGSRDPRVMDGRFFYHIGDALQRTNRSQEAYRFYEIGVENGLFLSVFQRSLYNEPNLTAKPWWTLEETTYADHLKMLEDNWELIRNEALSQMNPKTKSFLPEDENLREKGDWKQFNLYARGKRADENCKKAAFTCSLIEKIQSAKSCSRGQVKFSLMSPGVHVWPHCGPTNCRLRAHLGLIVPFGARIRVANETREWQQGKILVFDDSFEHEVWHDGTEQRLVLIIDLWHPELTETQRTLLSPI